MMKKRVTPIFLALSVLTIVTMACSQLATPEPTSTPTQVPPTNTLEPTATATKTPKPTNTPKPTATPNLAATQKIDDFNAILEEYVNNGYIGTTDGKITDLDDFEENWAQLGWYQWWPQDDVMADFVFKGHISWSSGINTPEVSGCGIIFGLQENDDHYAVFIDKGRILFLMGRGSNVYNVGKTSGSGRLNYGNPAEADLIVAIKEQIAYISVDGDVTKYTLSADQTSRGTFALSILSGTNKDYGTHCEMTDMMLWVAK
jgi:hypothetical protein